MCHCGRGDFIDKGLLDYIILISKQQGYEQGKLDQSFLSTDKNLGKTTLSEQDIYDILGMYDCLLDSNWKPSYYIKKLIKRLKSQIKEKEVD
jgi:hypothetical protein